MSLSLRLPGFIHLKSAQKDTAMKDIVVLFIVGLTICGASGCHSERPPATVTPNGANAANQTKQNTLASPVSWSEVASAYERIDDYSCQYEKSERPISNGEVRKIQLSFRKPFDVRMEWLDKQGRVDQVAVYRQGFNDGQVLVREGGLLGRIGGTLSLDPNGALALSDSRHPITEVGIGKIIDRANRDAANPEMSVHFDGEESLDGRRVYTFEFTTSGQGGVSGSAEANKALIWIDKELRLPIQVELYDATNALIERHHFKDIQVNHKLGDKMFVL